MNGNSGFPRLKIKLPSGIDEWYVVDLEQAGSSLDFEHAVFMVEGQTVHSYEELFALVTRDDYREKESLEVTLLQVIEGG